MENEQNEYHVSFFKPVTKRARKNRNMVIWLVLIWATGVFGFQILLRAIEKPTPEPAYTSYISVWDKVQSENASNEELKEFANSVLTVLGKVYIKTEYQTALSNAFTWALFQVADDRREELYAALIHFEKMDNESESILDGDYISSRALLEDKVSNILGFGKSDARIPAIPFSLDSEAIHLFSDDNKELTATAMPMYLIHNRSVLTDITFLGFPFHYFYTAVFLLILFIALCWIYCILTDRRENKELVEKTD